MKNYFKIAAYFVFVAGIMGISASTIFAISGGPADSRTGSPADGFKTCKDTNCHNSYPLNSGKATFSISAPDNYTLGEVVPITISFNNSNTKKHGFELSALDANDKHVGTFSSVDGKTQTSNGNYIKHTSAGSNQSGNASWNVRWTAPTSEVQNPVTFYAAGNEANGDFTPQGDYIYTTTAETTSGGGKCISESMSASPGKLVLKKGENGEVVVALIPAVGCPPEEGKTIIATVNKAGMKRISIPSSATTDANGEATFTITAKDKKGTAKVEFKNGDLKTTLKVKVK